MAIWRLNIRVDVMRVCMVTCGNAKYGPQDELAKSAAVLDANGILEAVAKVEPRPILARYQSGRVELSFMLEEESMWGACSQQSRIQDSLSKAIAEAKLDRRYAIEFDAPERIEVGTPMP